MKNQKYKDHNRRRKFCYNEIDTIILKGSAFLEKTGLKDKMSRKRKYNKGRIVNRCQVTLRDRSVIRKFKMTRGVLRSLLSNSSIAGMNKSSW